MLTTGNRFFLGIRLGYFERYTFDIESGEILATQIENRGLIRQLITLGGMIVVGLGSIFLLVRARRKRKQPAGQ